MMDLTLHYFVFALFWRMSSSVRCFQCAPDSYTGIDGCQHFNGSDRFIKDCTHSTICFKEEITMGSVVTVERGCASQTMSGDQGLVNGKWSPKDTIYEAYKEGCEEREAYDQPVKHTTCYCRGDLCNRSATHHLSYLIIAIAITISMYRIR